jgi:hypothetical protein
MEQDNSAFNQSEELDQARSENFRLDNDPQEPPSLTEGGFLSVINNHEIVPSEKGVVKNDRPPKPKHYFDVFTGSVIDRKFYTYFERSGVNSENVRELGVLLRENEVPKRPSDYVRTRSAKDKQGRFKSVIAIHQEKYIKPKTKKWTEDNYTKYGKWLAKAVAKPTNPKDKLINEKIINQAARLGLGPGEYNIEKANGSMSKFYKSINAKETHPIGIFDGWAIEDYIRYIKKIGTKIGKKPTENIFWEFAHKNPWSSPSPALIAKSIGGKYGIGPIMELAGYLDIKNWNDDDYIAWGKKFMKANDGMELSTPILSYLSPQELSPSARAIIDKFGMSNFKSKVQQEYLSEKEHEETVHSEKLAEIEQRITKGQISKELFESAASEEDLILFFAKYQVVHHLCPDWEESTKIIISSRGFHETNFVGSIRKLNNAFTAGDIESAALYLDVFDDIWPMNEYMQTYKLDEGYAEFRKVLAEKEKVRSKARTLSGIRRKKAISAA